MALSEDGNNVAFYVSQRKVVLHSMLDERTSVYLSITLSHKKSAVIAMALSGPILGLISRHSQHGTQLLLIDIPSKRCIGSHSLPCEKVKRLALSVRGSLQDHNLEYSYSVLSDEQEPKVILTDGTIVRPPCPNEEKKCALDESYALSKDGQQVLTVHHVLDGTENQWLNGRAFVSLHTLVPVWMSVEAKRNLLGVPAGAPAPIRQVSQSDSKGDSPSSPQSSTGASPSSETTTVTKGKKGKKGKKKQGRKKAATLANSYTDLD